MRFGRPRKLNPDQTRLAGRLLAKGKAVREIARTFNAHDATIYHWADIDVFPEAVKDGLGAALSVAQFGDKHPAAKPWKGEGPGILEIVADHSGNTCRAVYTVRFEAAVYVLHAFQKKSPKGIKTAEMDVFRNVLRRPS